MLPSTSTPRSITFAQEFEYFPFSPSKPPSNRLNSTSPVPREQEAPDSPIPPSDDLLPTNSDLLDSVRRAANRSNLPLKILSSYSAPSKAVPSSQSTQPGHATPNITSDTSGRPLEQNLRRLQNSMLENQKLLGKSPPSQDIEIPQAQEHNYLPDDISALFPSKITVPQLRQPTFPLNIDTILQVFHSSTPTPQASPFAHERSLTAATHNSAIIASHDFDLQRTFDAYPNSIISPGSEFRQVHVLRPLLQGHPFWPKIERDLTFGASYKFKSPQPSNEAREAENEALLAYGNHSSAKKRPDTLIKVSQKDTVHGWAFPITFECTRKIKGGRFGPLGVAQHQGITEKGEIVTKDRLAHDQTFSTGLAPSLNKAVDDTDDIELVYGWCIERLIHQVVALRTAFPSLRIFVCKFDWGAAYRRINGDGLLAANALTLDALGEFANVLSRLSFGGKTHPAMFSLFSETACDLCNDLTEFKDWDHTICSSPLQRLMGGPPNRLPEDIPFAPGKPLIVDVPAKPDGSTDVYLDDMIQLFVDREETVARASAVVPLVLHLMVRPNHPTEEPIKRTDILAEDKMMAEGSPSEIMRVLGWEFDTRRLLLILRQDKYLNWSKAVRRLADKNTRKAIFQELESTIGKLIHSSKGIPASRFFLQRSRSYVENLIIAYDAKHRAKQLDGYDSDTTTASIDSSAFIGSRHDTRQRPRPWFRFPIPQYVKEDMQVWVDMLKHAHDGVNFN